MDKMIYFFPEGHAAHAQSGHPERPERVEAVREALREAGWWDKFPTVEPLALPQTVLEGVHSPAYLSLLEMACRRGGRLDADTYVTPASWRLAHNAAGGAAAVARAVWRREANAGFALCRPPGHHATRGQGMGFCLLNNVALAAEYLLKEEGAKRIAIVDIDLHHGNGTQDVFWKRRDVFFASTHQVPLYPGSGALDERGAGEGLGYTLNLPMPPGSGDRAYAAALETVIVPMLEQYAPEMILVSFGFDAHWADPLGSLLLSAAGYYRIMDDLASFARRNCGGRVAVILEGGYDLDAARACSAAVVGELLMLPPEEALVMDHLGPARYRETQAWQPVIEAAQGLWGLNPPLR